MEPPIFGAPARQSGRQTFPRSSFCWGRIAKDGFQFQEFFEASLAPFSTIARLFVSAKATAEIDPAIVDVYIPCPNPLRYFTSPVDIRGCYEPGEAVRTVVRDPDGVVFVFVWQNAK